MSKRGNTNRRTVVTLVLLLVVGMFLALFLTSCDEPLEGPYSIEGISYANDKLYIQFKPNNFPPGLTIEDFALSRGGTAIAITEISIATVDEVTPVGYALALAEALTEGVTYKLIIERDEVKFIYAPEGAEPEENEFFFKPLRVLSIRSL